jgi:hypothetical protein
MTFSPDLTAALSETDQRKSNFETTSIDFSSRPDSFEASMQPDEQATEKTDDICKTQKISPQNLNTPGKSVAAQPHEIASAVTSKTIPLHKNRVRKMGTLFANKYVNNDRKLLLILIIMLSLLGLAFHL